MGDTNGEKWDTEKMREQRNDWSLAADIHLFSYMHRFSQNLLSETHTTLKALDSLESDVATTCVEVSNIGNRFWALSDTQFVENRVYDDDDVTSPVASNSYQGNQTEDIETVVIKRLKDAIQNGIQVLDSKFETVQVPASDSDEDDSSPHSGVILKPVNRYKDRRLPHLIGSAEFRTDDTLGLREAPSDEETDDFMSASDKANESESIGESEDSDIESDQTKTLHLNQKQNSNIFNPTNLRLPGLEKVQTISNAPSPPSGDMFDEREGDDLFSQMAHKKPMFSSWQPSDLWATEEEDEKRLGDDSSNNRPPSANSSVSSVQSSNVSEPIKKTSEDFGKSGTGRQAVLVQEDHDDLFGPKATNSTPPQTKEFVPAGGVKIFGGDFNPFSGRNPSKGNQSEGFPPLMDVNRSENKDVDEDIFAQKHNVPTKVLPNAPPSKMFSKNKEVSLFDDEEEDDLFSNRSSEPKAKSQPSSMSSSVVSVGVNRSKPKDDDLFSNSSLFSESKTQLSHSLFKDDSLFSDDSEDLFSNIDNNKEQKSENPTAVSHSLGESLFSDQAPIAKDYQHRSYISSRKPKTQNVDKDIFGGGEDLFDNITNLKGSDLFGGASSTIKPPVRSSISKEQTKILASNPLKKDIFDESDNDNDDLFGTSSKFSKTNQNLTTNQDWLFGDKSTTSLRTGKQEVVEDDDLFGPARLIPDVKNQHVKAKPSVLKPKKGLEKRSLFDSDSDDDLFSSPQGSLSSRKSVQSASAPTEPSESEDTKKLSKDLTTSRLSKTDFSSIFSNDQDETTDSKLVKKTDRLSNLFGEDVDLFSSSNVNVKTPDLFNKLSSEPVVGSKEDFNQVSKVNENEIKIKPELDSKKIEKITEAVNKQIEDTSDKTPVVSEPSKMDIFGDSLPENEEQLPKSKKLEPPKSLDIKPITERLQDNNLESKEIKDSVGTQKPPVSKKPSPKVLVEKSVTKDAIDGEVISPPSPSKSVPGKLKSSQLININTAALLPGARPSKSEPQLYGSSETRVQTKVMTPTLDATHIPLPSQTTVIPQNASDMPPKISLLQSVNKERVKIQSKRRPSSRRARQEAIRASSLDLGADSEDFSVHPGTSTLMSPSTDEEDLFGVPPLDVVYDFKTVSPSSDIFGTPTVISPANKELPTSFVSTPFVHSQPPPLEEEQEEGSNQEDDLFGSQSNLLGSLTKEKKQREVEKEVQSKKEIAAQDIFSDLEDNGLFRGIREAPPPLVDDEDDEEYDELFMTRKKKENTSSKISHSGSVIAALESLPKEDHLLSRPPHSTVSASGYPSSIPPKKQNLEDDSLFPSKGLNRPSSNSLFSTLEEPNEAITDDSLFSKSTKHSTVVTDDTLFPFNTTTKKPLDSYLGVSSNVKDMTDNSLVSKSTLSDEDDFSIFAKPSRVSSSELFSASDEISSRKIPDKPAVKLQQEESMAYDDELFGSHSKPSKARPIGPIILVIDRSKSALKTEGERPNKKEALFGEDEEEHEGNLFSSVSEKKVKVKPAVKSSLFGEEDDGDDIFGSLSSSKRKEAKTAPSAFETSKGSSKRAMKGGSSGSSKPVKLESKQTFSDPLLSQANKE